MPSDYELSGTNFDDENKYELSGGITIGYNHSLKTADKTEFGVGGEFMLNRSQELNDDTGAFHSVFGYGKYSLMETLYAQGRVGYNFHKATSDDVDIKGGITYGIGAGYSVSEKFSFDLIYTSHSAELETNSGLKMDGKYTNINLGFNCSF